MLISGAADPSLQVLFNSLYQDYSDRQSHGAAEAAVAAAALTPWPGLPLGSRSAVALRLWGAAGSWMQ